MSFLIVSFTYLFQKSDLEFHQVNGLGVDFAGMERAALSTALTQVAAQSAALMLNNRHH